MITKSAVITVNKLDIEKKIASTAFFKTTTTKTKQRINIYSGTILILLQTNLPFSRNQGIFSSGL